MIVDPTEGVSSKIVNEASESLKMSEPFSEETDGHGLQFEGGISIMIILRCYRPRNIRPNERKRRGKTDAGTSALSCSSSYR
jgi:hypothetical protein